MVLLCYNNIMESVLKKIKKQYDSIILAPTLTNDSARVVTRLVPPTGLPLPFISAGSTSIMIFM